MNVAEAFDAYLRSGESDPIPLLHEELASAPRAKWSSKTWQIAVTP